MLFITKWYIPKSNARSGNTLSRFSGVTIHESTSTKAGTTAKEIATYYNTKGGKNTKSACHYYVDENDVFALIPETEIARHCGDNESSKGNSETVSIEICNTNNFEGAMENAIELVVDIFARKGIKVAPDKIFTHSQLSDYPVNCPHKILSNGLLAGFIKSVQEKLLVGDAAVLQQAANKSEKSDFIIQPVHTELVEEIEPEKELVFEPQKKVRGAKRAKEKLPMLLSTDVVFADNYGDEQQEHDCALYENDILVKCDDCTDEQPSEAPLDTVPIDDDGNIPYGEIDTYEVDNNVNIGSFEDIPEAGIYNDYLDDEESENGGAINDDFEDSENTPCNCDDCEDCAPNDDCSYENENSSTVYRVQLAAFTSLCEARRYVSELEAMGIPALIV